MPFFYRDEKGMYYIYEPATGMYYPAGFAEPSRLGWAGIGMLATAFGTFLFAGLAVAGFAAAKDFGLAFFGSFSTMLLFFTRDKLR